MGKSKGHSGCTVVVCMLCCSHPPVLLACTQARTHRPFTFCIHSLEASGCPASSLSSTSSSRSCSKTFKKSCLHHMGAGRADGVTGACIRQQHFAYHRALRRTCLTSLVAVLLAVPLVSATAAAISPRLNRWGTLINLPCCQAVVICDK
jgi:hypothetical protein